jgi:hypothetical protein
MREINEIPWNGLTAISTFSGCGGSSLGYRMAGFRILYANEFIPAARDTYRANCSSTTIVDDRDIREVTAEDILTSTGTKVGDIDLFDGSPPAPLFPSPGNAPPAGARRRSIQIPGNGSMTCSGSTPDSSVAFSPRCSSPRTLPASSVEWQRATS